MSEYSVWVSVLEVRPRDPIDTITTPLSATGITYDDLDSNTLINNINVNPLKLIQYDVEKKKAKRQERYANGVPNDEMYPKGHAEQQTVNDWKFTSDAKSCKE